MSLRAFPSASPNAAVASSWAETGRPIDPASRCSSSTSTLLIDTVPCGPSMVRREKSTRAVASSSGDSTGMAGAPAPGMTQ